MTTLTEAARAALEALTNCSSEHGHRCNRCDSEVDEGGKVAEALRAALAASEVQAEPVAWVGPVFQLMPHVIYEAWSARYPDDAAHFKPLVYATAPEQPAPALAFAPRVPQGWQIEQLPSGEIAMHAQGIGSCVVAPAETQPRIIPTEMLYALAKALLAAAPQPEGDTP